MTFRAFTFALTDDEREVMTTYRPLAHKHIVLTGKLADGVLREDAAAYLYSWGAVIDTVVQPSTDVLLAVDPERMTQKRRDAGRFGVPIMDEDAFTSWLYSMLREAETARARLEGLAPAPPPAFFPEPPPALDFVDTIRPLSDWEG